MTLDKVPLKKIAHARSGDKGAHANIGVIAYTEEGYRFLKKYLTEERVKAYFLDLNPKKVVRYELANLLSFNFVLENVLDGGASLNLRCDSQGKTFGQALLEMQVSIDEPTLAQAQRER